ncbi:hypothetical protein VKT23_007321 [Stygiomarasmius scandens]|uniref:Uncharacterized protein n=1 Tax=Marasmiellus scandens TaxID=2682957 RepID=A0ABR1JQQ6_9AGAR
MMNLTDYLHRLSYEIDATYKAGDERLQNQSQETMKQFANAFIDFRLQLEHHESAYLTQMDASLSTLSQRHVSSFLDLLPKIENDLQTRLDQLFILTRHQQQLSLDMMNAAQEHWSNLRDEYSFMQDSIIHLSQFAAQTTFELELSRKHIQDIHQAHSDILSSTGVLNRSLAGFLDMTKEEFDKLNDSVGALQEGLGLVSAAYKIDGVFGMDTERWWARWWKERLVDVFAVVIKGAGPFYIVDIQPFTRVQGI